MRIDLHIHSTASDGALPPEAVVRAAVAGNLDVVALADHDTAAGISAAQAEAVGRLEVIPAIELSANHARREYHILGYYIDPLNPEMQDYTRAASRRREVRMEGMLRRLAALGIEVPYEDVLGIAGDASSVGRPHLARALMQRGHVRTFAEAFDRFIGDGGPAFVSVQLLTPADAISLIHAAGGVAVWAHPPADAFDHDIAGLVDAGLDGVECFRPRTLPADSAHYVRRARELELILTGGSDWHGEWQGPLGDFALRPEVISEFLALGGIA